MESGLRDIMIAEKEVVLTFLLQLLSERGILGRLAFKGGTCLRKVVLGNQGRFSTDLDFTGIEEHDHEDLIIAMMDAFEQPFRRIQFAIPDEGYYDTQDGLSSGVNPAIRMSGINAEVKSDSRLAGAKLRRRRRSDGLRSSRVISDSCPSSRPNSSVSHCQKFSRRKTARVYQRNKARDIYDLGMFAMRPLDRGLIRRLVVLKLWQARDTFDPARPMQKFADSRDFDWHDLHDLLRRTIIVDRDRITADCARGFAFLADLTDDERLLANDPYQRSPQRTGCGQKA